MSQFVFCRYCQCMLLDTDRRCPACGAPRPEYARNEEARSWPQYEQAVVALSTAAFPVYSTAAQGMTYVMMGTTEGPEWELEEGELEDDEPKVDEASPAPKKSFIGRLFR